MSSVFRAQLFGSFAESKFDSIIEYPTISPDVFKCIIRSSFSLDPNINEHTAILLMKAAQMLQIEALVAECVYFLSNCINQNNVLSVLNSAYLLNSLDYKFFRKCKSIIYKNPKSILSTEGFITLHPDLVIEILSWDYLNIREETIWTACVQWATNVISNKIQFPAIEKSIIASKPIQFSNDEKNDDEELKSVEIKETPSIATMLKLLIPHIRFPLMSTQFFVDKVKSFLTREQSDSVMVYYLLKRKPIFSIAKRSNVIECKVVAASCALDKAKKLTVSDNAVWAGSEYKWGQNSKPWFVVDIGIDARIESVEWTNNWSDSDCAKKVQIGVSQNRDSYDQDSWIKAVVLSIAQSTSVQKFNVEYDNVTSRYWRFMITETYGSENNYWGVNRLRLSIGFRQWI
eukprot:179086_1